MKCNTMNKPISKKLPAHDTHTPSYCSPVSSSPTVVKVSIIAPLTPSRITVEPGSITTKRHNKCLLNTVGTTEQSRITITCNSFD